MIYIIIIIHKELYVYIILFFLYDDI